VRREYAYLEGECTFRVGEGGKGPAVKNAADDSVISAAVN